MTKSFTPLLLAALALALLPTSVTAQDDHGAGEALHEEGGHEAEEFDPIHHSADGYYLDFSPFGKINLPRIFLVRNGEGAGFRLRRLRLDRARPPLGRLRRRGRRAGRGAGRTGGPPARLRGRGRGPGGADYGGGGRARRGRISPRRRGRHPHRLPPSRATSSSPSLAACIVAGIFISLARRYERGEGRETAPRGTFQNMFETLVVFIRDDIAKPNLGDKYRRFLPYLLTVFFFILTCNLLGLVPFGATATSNLMVTAVLAIFTFVITQVFASKDYWKHVFWPPGVPVAIKPILIPVEFLGLFTKPFALAIRLFANLTAGAPHHPQPDRAHLLVHGPVRRGGRDRRGAGERGLLALHLPPRAPGLVYPGLHLHHALGALHRHGHRRARARA